MGTMSTYRQRLLERLIAEYAVDGDDGKFCWYCCRDVRLRITAECRMATDATIDHVIPTSKGGTWDYENLALACWECNNRKGDCDLWHFLTMPHRLGGRRPERRGANIGWPMSPLVVPAEDPAALERIEREINESGRAIVETILKRFPGGKVVAFRSASFSGQSTMRPPPEQPGRIRVTKTYEETVAFLRASGERTRQDRGAD
jgi:HNH endonuclease